MLTIRGVTFNNDNVGIAALKRLLMRGHDPNTVVGNDGQPALHYACGLFNSRAAFYLIAAGADLYALNNQNQTPLEVLLLGHMFHKSDVFCAMASLGVVLAPTIERVFPNMPVMYFDERQMVIGEGLPNLIRLRRQLINTRVREVCVALHNLRISALELCEILLWSCCPAIHAVSFHVLWNAVVTIKHWKK